MPNHLANETSPYLLQHAGNPVDWHPWGEQALTLARQQNKPILLSIGYSACHWCHVMAHESFEDEEVAKTMNEHFVNIKVDREERPDLDHIYQTAQAMLSGRGGGWPLTMFLTPDQAPFFGGTYFPKEPRYNLPGFKDLLKRVAEFYRASRDEIEQQNSALLDAFGRTLPAKAPGAPEFSDAPLNEAIAELKRNFDMVHGGFSHAPKFPHPAELELCLRRYAATGSSDALHMAVHTLRKMAEGGIYDQIGGGFCRYSVDESWTIPHFEKMLYDNGPLLGIYADAWLATGEPLFKRVAEETAAWVMREMQSPEGGYYSTLDADSEHEEGKFYTWVPQEIAALLTQQEYAVAAAHYGLDGPPNFEERHWHLRVGKALEKVAGQLGMPFETCEALLASGRAKLFAAREKRVRPGRDEKILTSWNGLMIKGMARAGRCLGKREWIDSARRACDFLRGTLWKDGRLLATYKDSRAHLNAYLDDHAFLLDGLLELMQTEFRMADLNFARQLADILIGKFEDQAEGGFFFTSHDHEKLIHRPKSGHDNATPSGNGVAALALQRLGHLLGESRYFGAAERAVKLFYPAMLRQAGAFSTLAMALEEALTPPQIVVLRGNSEAMREWQQELAGNFAPHMLVIAVASGIQGLPAAMDKPVPSTAGSPGSPGEGAAPLVNAWLCQGVKCLPEISALQELKHACKTGKVV